jgi:3-dehydroquinate synthase
MNQQKVVISQHFEQSLHQTLTECSYDRLFVLVDETTEKCCLPVLTSHLSALNSHPSPLTPGVITIGATDQHKTLDAVSHVWSELQRMGATRHSLMINLGGGMVTDLGGFAASTFKRGIHFINVPTTLLSMVDASVGGKTGINFGGLKNEIGVFNNADCVILDTEFLKTLDQENILSGYAEMLKHGLIDCEEHWAEILGNLEHLDNLEGLSALVERSVAVKQRIVTEDPTEKGLRKALNLGHTAGHAFESLALERASSPLTSHLSPLLHGYAVAYGLVVELYLSCVKTGFPTDKMRQTVQYIKEHYGKMTITCDDYPHLLELMHHDKKNEGSAINFTLLAGIGDIRINQTATEEEIKEALDFYREN